MESKRTEICQPLIEIGKKGLKGIVSEYAMMPKSVITVNGIEKEVVSSKLIEFRLFTKSGKITASWNDNRIGSPDKLKRFLEDVGYPQQRVFTKYFFRNPVIVGSQGIVNLWFSSFIEDVYF